MKLRVMLQGKPNDVINKAHVSMSACQYVGMGTKRVQPLREDMAGVVRLHHRPAHTVCSSIFNIGMVDRRALFTGQ